MQGLFKGYKDHKGLINGYVRPKYGLFMGTWGLFRVT